MENDDVIRKLLALKRYERPPEGYEQSFLHEFHRRQRASLIRKNPWVLFLESLGDLWPDLHVPKLAYAGIAAVAILVAGVSLLAPPETSDASRVARAEPDTVPDFSLSSYRPVTITGTIPASTRPSASQHYVLQPSPANNDRPLSF